VTSPSRPTPGTTTPTEPTVSPTPSREVTEDNLIGVDDIPTYGTERYQVADPGRGRALDEISVCVRGEGWSSLGALTMVTHSFVLMRSGQGKPPNPDSPLADQPTIYTLAFQFPDAAAAKQAGETVRSWVGRCAGTLQADPTYRRPDPTKDWKAHWVPVKSRGRTVAAFADVPNYYIPPPSDSVFFESVGITQVADRLAVVVEIVYGQDYNVGYVQDDYDPVGPHPQFDLLLAANKALGR
jgi:hypothetical protein